MKRLLYALFVAGVLVSIISSCKKTKTTPVTPPPAGAVVVRSNVHIVDSTQWIIHGNIDGGIFSLTFTPNTPNVDVKAGDIIVGVTNGGYINKVRSVAINSGYLTLTTQPATMADVFLRGQFTLQVPMNDPNQSGAGVTRNLTNFNLYPQGSAFSVSLNGSFNIQPTLNLTFAFDSAAGLTNFQMATTNSPIFDSVGVTIKGQEPYNWKKDSIFSTINFNSVQWVTAYNNIQVPVVMKIALNFAVHGWGGSPNYGAINANSSATWISQGTFSGGLQYTANQWQPIYGSNVTNTQSLADSAYNADLNSNVSIVTQISSTFYRFPGPQLSVGISGNLYGTDRYAPGFSKSTRLWNVQTDAQVQLPVFGANIGAFNQTWTTDSIYYLTPYKVFLVSGNNDSANVATTLPRPQVIKVTDSNGSGVSGVTVLFTVTGGGGYLGQVGTARVLLVTDQNGSAQISNWTLGADQGRNHQILRVEVVDGNQAYILGAPAYFTATAQ